jgi:hypothetical protein
MCVTQSALGVVYSGHALIQELLPMVLALLLLQQHLGVSLPPSVIQGRL